MRRIRMGCLWLALMLALTACGRTGGDTPTETAVQAKNTEQTAAQTTAPVDTETSAEPTDLSESEVWETVNVGSEPQPAETEPDTEPTPESTEPTAEPTEPTAAATLPPETEMPTQPPQTQAALPVEVTLPCTVANGKLSLESLFQFSGTNPDCGYASGENVAGLYVTNCSGSHLLRAEITVTMTDGTELTFEISHLPAGAVALVFERGNTSVASLEAVASVGCSSEFADESPLMTGQVEIEVDGTLVTITNVSGQDLSGLTVYCHCLLDGEVFGGLVYEYTVEELPAGGQATVDAWECFLGEAEVVCVSRDG